MTREQAEKFAQWLKQNMQAIQRCAEGGVIAVEQSDERLVPTCSMGYLIHRLADWSLKIKPTPNYRPYNREECERLNVLVREKTSGDSFSIHAVRCWCGRPFSVVIDGRFHSAEEFMELFEHLDGTPCGVKEGE